MALITGETKDTVARKTSLAYWYTALNSVRSKHQLGAITRSASTNALSSDMKQLESDIESTRSSRWIAASYPSTVRLDSINVNNPLLANTTTSIAANINKFYDVCPYDAIYGTHVTNGVDEATDGTMSATLTGTCPATNGTVTGVGCYS